MFTTCDSKNVFPLSLIMDRSMFFSGKTWSLETKLSEINTFLENISMLYLYLYIYLKVSRSIFLLPCTSLGEYQILKIDSYFNKFVFVFLHLGGGERGWGGICLSALRKYTNRIFI